LACRQLARRSLAHIEGSASTHARARGATELRDVMVYRLLPDAVQVLRVLHATQQRPAANRR